MKKSLLALAVLGAVTGAASAQTNVTIYGLFDVAATYEDKGNGETWSLDGSNFTKNGSRLGFKGSEDLGGGLSAIFTLENGFNGDTGTLGQGGRIFGRQAFVGLQGGFGAVKLGRQYTPMHLALDAIDPFATGMVGNIENVFNGNGIRMDNTLNYSITVGGISGALAYGLGEATGDNSANAQYAAGLGYANGPINVQFAYHHANTSSISATTNQVVPGVDDDTESAFLGGSFDFRVAKIHAGYQKNEVKNAAGTKTTDQNNYMLGVSAPIGAGSIVGSYIKSQNDATDRDTDQYAIGYIHNLSKRTSLYTAYARTETDGAADIDRFQVGIQHRF